MYHLNNLNYKYVGRVLDFSITSISHKGLVRSYNQDTCWYLRGKNSLCTCVADGLGGHACGEKASQIVVDTFKKVLDTSYLNDMTEEIEICLNRLISKCNDEIFSYSDKHPECLGMGTTVVCGVVTGNKFFIAHIGDSRCYVIRNGNILYRTKDHTVVQELINRGELPSLALEWDPRRHILSRCLGGYDRITQDIEHHPTVELHSGDYLLLCSDGLSNMVIDSNIVKCISRINNDVEKKGQDLLQMALVMMASITHFPSLVL